MKDKFEFPGYAKCSTYIGCSIVGFICSKECLELLEDQIAEWCGEEAFTIYEHVVEIPINYCYCQTH